VGQVRDLVGRVHRIIAADVQEIADVMGTEDVDDPLEILVLIALELVPASADRAGRRCTAQ
jgi:hypothetical protein